jgi:YARHG domain
MSHLRTALQITGPAIATLVITFGAATTATAQSCNALWHERNAIYARNGYCFETARARAVFGPGCFPPYGELSGWDKERVNELQTLERRNGC